MGQPSAVYEVADGIDAREVGFHLLVDAHPPTLVIESLVHEAFEAAGVGAAAHGHQHIFGAESLWPFFGAGLHFFQIPIVCQGFHFCSGDDVDAALRQYAHEQAAHLFVNGSQDVWQHFDNSDVGTQGVKHAGQFHTDSSAADAEDAFRYFG